MGCAQKVLEITAFWFIQGVGKVEFSILLVFTKQHCGLNSSFSSSLPFFCFHSSLISSSSILSCVVLPSAVEMIQKTNCKWTALDLCDPSTARYPYCASNNLYFANASSSTQFTTHLFSSVPGSSD